MFAGSSGSRQGAIAEHVLNLMPNRPWVGIWVCNWCGVRGRTGLSGVQRPQHGEYRNVLEA